MDMQKVKELIKQVQAAESVIEQREKELSELRKADMSNKDLLANYFQENMLTKLEIDGLIVTAEHKAKYTIAGGKKSSAQRTSVIDTLESIGLIESAKIETFREYNGNALNSAMAKLAEQFPDKFTELLNNKTVYLYNEPAVKIKRG